MILLVVVLLSMASLFVLPASLMSRFLPGTVHAEDFSGSLLHGAAGRLRVGGRDAGALEWHLHPVALLRLTLAADIHWVKIGFVIDGAAEVSRTHFAARAVHGGGPIENLNDLGVAPGWRGIATLNFDEISGDSSRLEVVVGTIDVSNVSSSSVAAGSDLGGYQLQLQTGSVETDGTVKAALTDTGGPVELHAQLRLSPAARTGMLSGTLKEGPDASADLRNQISGLAQLHAADVSGRFPVDLEFTF